MAMKPHTAPMIIIPSTPRLRTPDFSTINSPNAANSTGIDATTMVEKKTVGFIAAKSINLVSVALSLFDILIENPLKVKRKAASPVMPG